jgi:hypothetical protein
LAPPSCRPLTGRRLSPLGIYIIINAVTRSGAYPVTVSSLHTEEEHEEEHEVPLGPTCGSFDLCADGFKLVLIARALELKSQE